MPQLPANIGIDARFLTEADRALLATDRFGRTPAPGDSPAVVVIDMQRAVVGDDLPPHEQSERYRFGCGRSAWRAVEVMEPFLDRARSLGVPVIYTRHLPGQPSEFDPQNPLSEIVDRIAPKKGDLVVRKDFASGFAQTRLLAELVSRRVDTILVTGNTTSGCVRATIVDGIANGFRCVCVADAVFDRFDLSHQASMLDLWTKYCCVLTASEALVYLESACGAGPAAKAARGKVQGR